MTVTSSQHRPAPDAKTWVKEHDKTGDGKLVGMITEESFMDIAADLLTCANVRIALPHDPNRGLSTTGSSIVPTSPAPSKMRRFPTR